jgi:hypothetical protein
MSEAEIFLPDLAGGLGPGWGESTLTSAYQLC